ncbi:SUMF1/EgtB/PvdO family nonheme iron enzyme [Microcoleus sp. MOSTC5]|uniref:SUMF1/EgtB/PvdO family nonheme iron enzyme n=1 Tax=Microcoleus sp. MOSTC5 TaxID=3055378 RepID=UPI002FD42723
MQFKRKSNGQVITLGSKIASGGEGIIYEFPPDASLVAKVYKDDKLKDIDSDKLQLMLANPPDDSVAKSHGCVSIAWPVDLLLSINGHQQIIGFLMPRVPKQQVRPIHDYYTPKTRREENLGFNYLSLHRTARNFAAAMSALHAKQYVIGDVNESNILVYDTAMVTLVDTDSFQVRDFQQGKVYRCPVGKAEYTPPELQGKTFSDYDRTPEHDLFGLGVLIFQLLMEGMHPFAAVYQGTGEPPPTEKRILTGHFPYGTKKVPYGPAPRAVPFEVLHPRLRHLLVCCFEDGHSKPQARPDARTWMKALDEAEKALVSCGVNSEHRYGGHLSDCPWCERKKQLTGIDPFPAISGGQSNIFAQIPLQPASKPKPVSSPAPTPTPNPTAIPYQPTPTPAPAYKSSYQPTPTPTPSTRRNFLTLAGSSIVAVSIYGALNKYIFSSLKPKNITNLPKFEFETVTVDVRGNITNRQRHQAQFISENLGSGAILDMVAIPGGSFVMSSPSTETERSDYEGPQHNVNIPPFFMGKYEVTNEQYQAVMGNNPSNFKGAKRPVANVSWDDAVEFCHKLTQKTGKTYRLPSEAEWEYACRARTSTPFYFGDTITPDLVNYDGSNSPYGSAPKGLYRQQTTDVGSFPPNAFGLYDMHGNVYEWCSDKWHDNYNGAPTDGSSWETGGDNNRVQRGGSWKGHALYCRCAFRYRNSAVDRYRNFGFRVALVSA